MKKGILYHPFFIKLFNWEYWPFHVVYGPIYFYWIWLCIRARSFFFFNASNPSIRNGGFLMESKNEIYELIPSEYYPSTLFFKAGTDEVEISGQVKKSGLQFPLIGKPDIGMKGLSVKKLNHEEELKEYARQSKVDFLVQDFIPYENELGIFYYRFPDEAEGKISGIVKKEFLFVEGDGVSTIEELLKKDKRFILQLPALRSAYGNGLSVVLPLQEKKILVPYGNHARGAKFLDASNWADEELTMQVDRICKSIPGFYYGRMDIRYNTLEELKQGKNFSIIELNGAGSEPTHIYDPEHSVFFAWREIIRHWKILWKISRINHKKNKLPYMSAGTGIRMFRANKAYVKLIAPEYNQPDLK